jgi:hypothetical protein
MDAPFFKKIPLQKLYRQPGAAVKGNRFQLAIFIEVWGAVDSNGAAAVDPQRYLSAVSSPQSAR